MIMIYSSYVVLAITVAILTYISRAYFSIKVVSLAAVVALGLSIEGYYRDQLGAPIASYPEGEFTYVWHETKDDTIHLWVWTEEKGNRLHVIPFDQETAEELEEAKEKSQAGQEQQGAFDEGTSGTSESQDLEIKDKTQVIPDIFRKE